MPQISDNFTQLTDLDPVLAEIFYQQYSQIPAMRNAVFGVQTSNKAKETDLLIGSFADPAEFKGVVEYQDAEADYEVEYSHTEFVTGFQVERKLMDDMQYPSIFANASEMGTAFARKQEKDAWSVFNNAFSTSFAGYDAYPLCELTTGHPRSQSDTTQVVNELALALNHENLETAIQTLMGLGDNRGEEITIVPNLLIVPRALRKTAKELVESELTPESANNAINVHRGFAYMEVPYLSDSNAWFVLDTVMSRRYLKWFDRIPVEFAAETSFDTFMRKYRGYMRYSYGWSNFRFIVGSNPS